ncbi:hypothetical protein cypCar_00024003 [Cyprinus carpio]|nr:hypothetical protein cypCar_00024003 [Cyprinus carpio]
MLYWILFKMTGRNLYLFNRSVSDIVLAAGADHTIQVFDMNQGCMATQISDAHCRAAHHLTQNKLLYILHRGQHVPLSKTIFIENISDECLIVFSFGVTLSLVSFVAGISVLYTGLGIIQSLPEQCINGWSEIVGPAHCKVY